MELDWISELTEGCVCVRVSARRLGVYCQPVCQLSHPKQPDTLQFPGPGTFCSARLLWPSFLFSLFQFHFSSLDQGFSLLRVAESLKGKCSFLFINRRTITTVLPVSHSQIFLTQWEGLFNIPLRERLIMVLRTVLKV